MQQYQFNNTIKKCDSQMNKALKKDTATLKFDTSQDKLRCFVYATSALRHTGIESPSRSYRTRRKQKHQRERQTEFQDKAFLSSVVCKVFNDANTQEIGELIDTMNFPSSGSSEQEKKHNDQIEHLRIEELFQMPNNYSPYTPKVVKYENLMLSSLPQYGYYQPRLLKTPEKLEHSTMLQSSPSQQITKSPEIEPYSPPPLPYSYYYQNTGLYQTRQNYQQRKKRNTTSEETSQFIIQLEKIESDGRTTLMIRHIPNKYSEQMLYEEIAKNFRLKINFLYLPVDHYNQCNVGYAFVNFIHTKFICQFYQEFNGRRWDYFNSEKICQLAYARIQGANSLINHFQNYCTGRKAKECHKDEKSDTVQRREDS